MTIAEQFRAEGRMEGEVKGEVKGQVKEKIETAERLLAENADIAFIARITKLSKKEILKLKKPH